MGISRTMTRTKSTTAEPTSRARSAADGRQRIREHGAQPRPSNGTSSVFRRRVDTARAASNLVQAMSRFGADLSDGDLRNPQKDGMSPYDWFAAAVA